MLCYLSDRRPGDSEVEEEQPKNAAESFIDVTEYLVKHREDQSHIHLIGKKQIFLSQSAQRNRHETMSNLFFLPYFDAKGRVKGARMILREGKDNQKSSIVADMDKGQW